MRQHVVIRREQYVAGSRDKPEVGVFTQTHAARPPVPWNRISVGEPVWMKWQGGPIVAQAKVQGFRQIDNCTSGQLRETTLGCGLHGLTEYWASRPPTFWGLTVYLEDEQWLDEVILPQARSYSESWIVLEDDESAAMWLDRSDAPEKPLRASSRGRSRTMPKRLRFEILRRDGFACCYCGRHAREVKLHVDHVVPWSKGGATTPENLRTACQDCNLGKSDRLL